MEQKQGRFDQISNETYHNEIPWAYSKSDLDEIGISPSNLVQKRKGPKNDSDALRFGSAMHLRFEFQANEDEYLKRIAVPPDASRATKEGKALHAEFELEMERNPKLVIDRKEWDQIERMLAAVKAHPDANLLLNAKGALEETFIWQDPDTGVWCKCRPDKRVLEAPAGFPEDMLIDWKTVSSCNPRDLEKSIAEYGYHIQAAFCTDGVSRILGRKVGPFVNGFIEKNGQHRVVLGLIRDEDIEAGRRLYKEQLAKIAECTKSGVWPGFVDLSLPAWAR